MVISTHDNVQQRGLGALFHVIFSLEFRLAVQSSHFLEHWQLLFRGRDSMAHYTLPLKGLSGGEGTHLLCAYIS